MRIQHVVLSTAQTYVLASATRFYHAFIVYASTSEEASTELLGLVGESFPNTNKIIEHANISNRQ